MLSKIPSRFFYFLGAILALNLIQAAFTDLLFDEAYYWYYAKQIAWGYFDHPPMVAWLIKLSGFIFDGELGVRFMSCMLSAATLVLLWLTIEHQKKNEFIPHFFVVAFSMTLLNAYGFFTLPDTPLLFFTALFLFVYKKFLNAPSIMLSIGLGIVMAALMYSKYHAVLVIFFVLLSNIKLVVNKYAWLAVLVALVCYMPHFNWLYEHDFVSINYHLFDRPNAAYNFKKYTGGFFLNLIAIFGFTFPFMYWALFKTKPTTLFSKALLYLTYGVILFFFISSFNRRVQTQWIIVISIPMVLIVFEYILANEKIRALILKTGTVTIIALLILRVGLIYEPLFPIKFETHGSKEWVKSIGNEAWDIPVVFENSYRNAPMYEFYTGGKAISLNNISYRRNQYTIDNSEASVQKQLILYVSKYKNKETTVHFPKSEKTTYYGRYIKNFESYRKLKCIVDDFPIDLDPTVEHGLKVYNPYDFDIPMGKLRFGVGFSNNHKKVLDKKGLAVRPIDKKLNFLKSKDTTHFVFKLGGTKLENPSYLRVVISENKLPYGLNGENIKIK